MALQGNESALWLAATNGNVHLACRGVIAVAAAVMIHRFLSIPRTYQLLPIWAALEIAIISYLVSEGGWGRQDGSLFGSTSKHQVLVDFPSWEKLVSKPLHTIQASAVQYTLFTRVFGGVESPQLKAKLEKSCNDLRKPIEKMHLNGSNATAALERANVPQAANSFVTFSSSSSQMRKWELSADVEVIGQRKVEANLQSLTRDFGACIVIPLLYGKDFLNRYEGLLDDFWKFDNDLFPMLMIGIPKWAPFKMIKNGLTAQTRLLRQMEALYRRIDQYQKGELVDFGADMSDISEAAMERNKVYERDSWSFSERAGSDLAILWGQNANTQPVLFWLLSYVYSTNGLVDRLREEIQPYVSLSGGGVLEISSMDIPGPSQSCQLLKACIFETFRLVNDPTSIRYVAQPVTIEEPGYSYNFNEGTFISAPHAITNFDPVAFPEPRNFVPERFLETGAESRKLVTRCGYYLPVGHRTFGRHMEVTSYYTGNGVKKPLKDIRVAITRRKL